MIWWPFVSTKTLEACILRAVTQQPEVHWRDLLRRMRAATGRRISVARGLGLLHEMTYQGVLARRHSAQGMWYRLARTPEA